MAVSTFGPSQQRRICHDAPSLAYPCCRHTRRGARAWRAGCGIARASPGGLWPRAPRRCGVVQRRRRRHRQSSSGATKEPPRLAPRLPRAPKKLAAAAARLSGVFVRVTRPAPARRRPLPDRHRGGAASLEPCWSDDARLIQSAASLCRDAAGLAGFTNGLLTSPLAAPPRPAHIPPPPLQGTGARGRLYRTTSSPRFSAHTSLYTTPVPSSKDVSP